jgi:hypothetical protein
MKLWSVGSSIRHLQGLAGAGAKYARHVHAVLLIQHDRCGWNGRIRKRTVDVTKTLANAPSAPTTKVGAVGRLPTYSLLQRGSAPIREIVVHRCRAYVTHVADDGAGATLPG